jgi:hypothetical protein
MKDEAEGRKNHGFQFDLADPDGNLVVESLPRHIDAGFDDFRLRGEPRPVESFVTVDLPMPELITFFPPPVPVQFVGSRLGMMPTNHVLEYRVSDFDKISNIKLNSPQLGSNGPLSCSDLLRQYEEHWRGMTKERESRQRAHIEADLYACAKSQVQAFFIGVGLPPYSPAYPGKAALHARNFFNKLLSLFPKAPGAERMTLVEVDTKPCRTAGDDWNSPRLVPAVQSDTMPQARLIPASYADDCRAGGLIVGP